MKTRRIISLIMTILFLINLVVISTGAKTTELSHTDNVTVEITSYEQLQTLLSNSPNGEKLVLQNDIILDDNKNDNELIVGFFTDCTLDLNGYTLGRTTRGIDSCLINVKDGATFEVTDSSNSKTGRMIFRSGNYAGTSAVMIISGDADVYGGTFEILTPYEVGFGVVFLVEQGNLDIYDGVFDSHEAYGGDTIELIHNAYMYDVPHCNIYGGTFYGKYSNFEVASYSNFTKYGCFYPSVYVYDGEFYIANPDDDYAGFAYCSNGWGQVIVAGGTIYYRCLNRTDEKYVDGVTKKLTSITYEGQTGAYYQVTPPTMIGSDALDIVDRLSYKFAKKELSYYSQTGTVYQQNKEIFDAVMSYIDTLEVPAAQEQSPLIWIENADNIKTTAWYFSDSAFYDGENTPWVELPDYRGKVNPFRFDFRPKDETTLYIRALITKDDDSQVEEIFAIHYEKENLNPAITSVDIIKVDMPIAGHTPDFTVDTASRDYYINALYWTDITASKTMKETDVFEIGHTYELQVWLRTNDGYKFRTDADGYIDITAMIGGKPAEVALIDSEISAIITITYTLNAPEEISFVDIGEIDEPVAGNTPDKTAFCYTQGCNVDSVVWYDRTDGTNRLMDENEKFVEGRKYRVVVGVVAEGPYTFEMFDGYNEATATINGERANASGSHDDVYAEFFYDFAPCKANDGYILGDVDLDGNISIMDATLIQLHIASLTQLNETQLKAADTDKSGDVSIMDATAIQLFIAKLITEF